MAQSSDRKRASIGVLFWIAFILLVLVIFLANRSNIEQVLDSTGLLTVVKDKFGPAEESDPAGSEGTESLQDQPTSDDPQPESDVAFETETDTPTPSLSEDRPAPEPSEGGSGSSASDDRGQTVSDQDGEPRTTPQVVQRSPSPDPSKPNRLMASLYFIKVTDQGRTYPQKVLRPVYYATSPLTETINALIAGPSGDELEDGLLNLIPGETKLLSAHVEAGVAYLNFSTPFRFNQLGAEGMVGQLQQIIFSSTEFPTVSRVQFMVDGERLDYLGGEGIYIGEPLGRDAFS